MKHTSILLMFIVLLLIASLNIATAKGDMITVVEEDWITIRVSKTDVW